MMFIIIGLNLIGVIWGVFGILHLNKNAIKMSMSEEIYSFKTKRTFMDYIQKRYLNFTFLDEKITLTDLGLFYSLWLMIMTLVTMMVCKQWFIRGSALFIGILLPIFAMEKYIKWVDLSIDKGIFNFLTQVNSRLVKSEDIMIAIRDSQNAIENRYINQLIKKFNQAVKMGVSPARAFKTLQDSTKNEYIKYIFLNIEIVYKRRGNVAELMRAIENEYTSIQVEINKRKVELEHDRNLMLFSLLLVVFTTVKIVKDHDYIMGFFIRHIGFTVVLTLFFCIGMTIIITANPKHY